LATLNNSGTLDLTTTSSAIYYDNTASGLAAETVKAAIDENAAALAEIAQNKLYQKGTDVGMLKTLTGISGTDQTVTLSDGGIQIESTAAGTTIYTTHTKNYSLAGAENISFEVYIDDTNLSKFQMLFFYFMNDDSNMYYKGCGTADVKVGWNHFSYEISELSVLNAPSVSTAFTKLQITLESKSGQMCTIKARNVVINRKGDKPRIVITFDDNMSGVYDNAFPLLKTYGYKATMNVVPVYVDQAGFMTLEQIKEIYNDGWSIANHTYNHYTDPETYTMESAVIQSEISDAKKWFINNGFMRGCLNQFAYHGGGYHTEIAQELAGQGYVIARDTEDGLCYAPYPTNLRYKSVLVKSDTTAASVITKIDKAIALNATLILYLHNVVTSEPTGSETAYSVFEDIIEYIHANNIDVLTYDKWYNTVVLMSEATT
jgi:peptidoglycan/xylan/chitin deacetylase (PgdA/CDA1 family)